VPAARRTFGAYRFPLLAAAFALLALGAAPAAFAATTYYWDNNSSTAGFGTAGGTWAAPTPGPTPGWSTSSAGTVIPASVTTSTDDTVNFGTTSGLAAGTVTVSGTVAAGNMTYGSASGAIVLSGGTITLAAASTITVNNTTNTIDSVLSGATTSLTKAGTGTLKITGNNSAIAGGDLFINAGTVHLANGATATGPNTLGGADGWTVQLGNTSGSSTATLLIGNSFSLANAITVRTGSTGTKTLANSGNPNTGNFSGNITANDNLTVSWTGASGGLTVSGAGNTIANTKTVSFSSSGTGGTLTDSAIWGGPGKIAYSGDDASGITVSGQKTYSGGAALNAMSGAGVIAVNGNSTPTSGTLTSGPFGTGTMTFNASRLRAGITADVTLGNAITFAGNMTFPTVASEKSLIFTGNGDLGAATRTLTVDVGSTVAGKVVDFQGAISSATPASGITKAGAGTLKLTGANTYTGNTTVTGGTLNITGTLTGNTTTSTLALGTAAANTVVNVSNDMTLFAITGANIAGSSTAYNHTAGTVNTYAGSYGTYVAGIGYGYFNLTGGTFKVNTGNFAVTNASSTSNVGVAYVGGTGILDLSTAGSGTVGYAGTGSLTVGPGGSVNRVGATGSYWLATNANSTGFLNVAGGSFDAGTSAIRIGNNTAGVTGHINLAKGTLTMGANISNNAGSGGILYANYAGGTLKASANLTNPVATTTGTNANVTATSTLFGPIDNPGTADDFTGGLTVDTNGFAVTYGNVLLGATGNGVKQGDLAVTGGSGYIGAPLVQFTGGTLAANGTPAAGYAVISGGAVTGIVITSPGTYTDDPTVTLTGGGGTGASVALSALTANAADSGLTKISSGALTLTAANTYAGPTLLSGGTLTLSGSGAVNSSSGITVNGSGAKLLQTSSAAVSPTVTLTQGTLTGNGTVNTVIVGAGTGGIVSNNDGVASAALTIGTLAFGGAATVNTFSSSTAAPIVTTALSSNLAGTVTINPTAAFWADGATYDLISYGGGSIGGGGFGQFALGTVTGLSGRQSTTFGNSGTAVTLAITGDTPYWSGDGDGKWNLASTNNWKLVSNNNPDLFQATDNVLFNNDATGAGPIGVDIDAANVAPTSTTFNSTKDYVLGSTGGFGISSGILIKSGAGTVTINNANTYGGGTTVSNGTLVLGNASAIGTGTLTLSGGKLDSSVVNLVNANNNAQAWNGDFTFVGTQNLDLGTGAVTMSADRTVTVSANTLTVGGAIGGGGGLTKAGTGTLNLKGTNTFTGAVAVNAGTLALSPAGALTMTNTFTGTGTLNINPGTTNLTLNGNLSGFTGTINVAPPVASPGKLVTGASSPLGSGAIVNIASGGTWYTNNATQTGIMVNISGTGNGEGYGALRTDTGTIDANSSVVLQADSSIGGATSTNTGAINAIISENVGPFSLTKVQANSIALGGANTYKGLTTVSAGSLILRNAKALGTTDAGTTVASGARVELDNLTVAGEAITVNGNGTNFYGALQGRSGTSVWTGNVTIGAAADTRIGAAAGASLEVSGVIDDGVNDYRIMYRVADSAATVIISGNNTYTGGTSIVGTGPVVASSLNKVVGGSLTSNFGAPVTEANGMIIIGTTTVAGTLRYIGSGETTDRTVQIGANNATTPAAADTGGATIENNGTTGALSFSAPTFNTPTNAATGTSPTRTLTLGGTNTAANTVSGVIQNNQIAGAPSAAVALTKTGTGTWTLAGANTYTGLTTVSDGTLNLTGNRLSSNVMLGLNVGGSATPTLNIGGDVTIGGSSLGLRVGHNSGPGIANQTGGTVSFASGDQLVLATQGNATYNLSGGTLTTISGTNRGVILGTNAGYTGTFNLSGSGTLTMASGSSMQIGRGESGSAIANTTGIFNQTGGVATVAELRMGGAAAGNVSTTAQMNLSAGTFSAATFTNLSVGDTSTSTINISGAADVTLPAFPTTRGSGATATINFDGGTLKPAAASATYMGGLTNAFIKAGGAKFDVPGGKDITITQALLTDPESAGGGLTKSGAGTLTLSGANTYTGDTTISNGVLAISNPYLDDASAVTISIVGGLNLSFADSLVDIVGDLWLGLTHATPGTTYNSANGGGYITGTGNIKIASVEGDTNGDSVVDAADFITLKKNFGKSTGAGVTAGDFNSSGTVDWTDLSALMNNMGNTGGTPATTPEPCSAILLIFGAAALLRRRRKA
jgi:autotransporter-associated beta strand protein